jgi:hypothetical protein
MGAGSAGPAVRVRPAGAPRPLYGPPAAAAAAAETQGGPHPRRAPAPAGRAVPAMGAGSAGRAVRVRTGRIPKEAIDP